MIKIGITGGIGSGKSVIANLLKIYNIPVYIADIESKRLTAVSPIIRQGLTTLLGHEVYTSSGLNRTFLASQIFNNADILKKVNAIIHPEVNKHYLTWVSEQNSLITAMESAILFESGFDKIVDICLMVYAPKEIRIQRAMSRENTTREEIIRRIDNQLDDEIKKERTDYIIYNDEQHALIPQIQHFLSSIGYLSPL